MTVGEFKKWLVRNDISEDALLIIRPGSKGYEDALPTKDTRYDNAPIVLFEW